MSNSGKINAFPGTTPYKEMVRYHNKTIANQRRFLTEVQKPVKPKKS